MSFVPSKRLLWIVALVIVPAWLVLGMAGAPLELLVLAGVVVVGLAAVDALTSSQQLNGVSVQFPPLVRTSKGKTFYLAGVIVKTGPRLNRLRIGLPLPRHQRKRRSTWSPL